MLCSVLLARQDRYKSSDDPKCEPNYTLMGNPLSWADANAACLAGGLQLASVQSAAENALLVTAAAGNHVWIGGTDAASEGAWVWIPSNTPITPPSYTNWGTGEPNSYGGNEDCLLANWGSTGTWNDGSCNNQERYICGSACATQPLQVSRSHTASTPSLLSDTPSCCSSRVSSHLCASAPHPLVSTQCEACDNLTCAAGYYRGGTGCNATVHGSLYDSSYHRTDWADRATPAHIPPTVCPALSTTGTSAFGAAWASTRQRRARATHARIVEARFTLSTHPHLSARSHPLSHSRSHPHAHTRSQQH